MLKLVKVKGDSMHPCYRHNDYLLLSRLYFRPLRPGDDVVCIHPHYQTIVKRIAEIDDNKIHLTGLNTRSTSKYHLGTISQNAIIGKVIWHIRQ